MKMFNVNFRVIASFVLAIFLTTLSVVLIAWACDSLWSALEDAHKAVEDAQAAVDAIREEGVASSISTSSTISMVSTGAGGAVLGFGIGLAGGPLGAKTLAIIGGASGAVTGGVSGAINGAVDYYDELSAAEDNLAERESERDIAQSEYEDCVNPPARYTYTDPNSGYVYEFCETMYGSASNAYTAYMEFLANRGH